MCVSTRLSLDSEYINADRYLIAVIVFHGRQVVAADVSYIAEVARLRRVAALYPVHLLRTVLFYTMHL